MIPIILFLASLLLVTPGWAGETSLSRPYSDYCLADNSPESRQCRENVLAWEREERSAHLCRSDSPFVCTYDQTTGVPHQYTQGGSLKIDKASFDAMLHDNPEAKLRVMLTNDPCLARMEQAMRAWDEFVKPVPEVLSLDLAPSCKPYESQCLRAQADRLDEDDVKYKRQNKAMKLWQSVKAACWRRD